MKSSNKNWQPADLILDESPSFLIVNKPAGMLSVSSPDHSLSILETMQNTYKKQLYPVNRLDRPVSGIQVIAKSPKTQTTLSSPGALKKTYIAIVQKKDIPQKGMIEHYLKKDGKRFKSLCSDKPNQGYKKSLLSYEVIYTFDNYLALQIQLLTGRFHQIRAQLSAYGIPVKGDVKYGARRKNPDRTIDLHAWTLEGKELSKTIQASPLGRQDNVLWEILLNNLKSTDPV